VAKNYSDDVKRAQESIDFAKKKYQVQFDTTAGSIKVDLWPDVAPGHCKNLVALAKVGFYDGIKVHRVVPNFVIQAGCPEGTGTGGPGYKIKAEFNDRKHEAGVLSMARTQDPNSAGSQFFLCLADVPFLNNQYTAFGKTADKASLDVVLAIGKMRTDARDMPVEDVVIKKASVSEAPL
jgi:cyclophilin family peptidyl-prolyl cis-trans isomerase